MEYLNTPLYLRYYPWDYDKVETWAPNQYDVSYCNPTMKLIEVKSVADGWSATIVINERIGN